MFLIFLIKPTTGLQVLALSLYGIISGSLHCYVILDSFFPTFSVHEAADDNLMRGHQMSARLIWRLRVGGSCLGCRCRFFTLTSYQAECSHHIVADCSSDWGVQMREWFKRNLNPFCILDLQVPPTTFNSLKQVSHVQGEGITLSFWERGVRELVDMKNHNLC